MLGYCWFGRLFDCAVVLIVWLLDYLACVGFGWLCRFFELYFRFD